MRHCDRIDVAVVGGGVVGSACALALARQGLQVALVEAKPAPAWSSDERDLRVYAIAPDNAGLLDRLGVWHALVDARVQPYRRMRVWDAGGGGELCFDADAFGRRQLGWIIEHGLLLDRLWQALPAAGVDVRCPASVAEVGQDDAGVRLRLEDGDRLQARLAVAADGADSRLRASARIEVRERDYAQRGVVCHVATELPHAQTAWQRFLPGGPLAFLPFADGGCSIVWSLPNAEAARVLALDVAAFDDELTRAFQARLGAVRATSARVAFPLRQRLAAHYVQGRLLLIGDAAHVVHPLAGQGVNMGLRDVTALSALMARAQARRQDIAAPHRLERWARVRRSENTVAAHLFDAIGRTFSNDHPAATLLRGRLLGAANALPPLMYALWRRAAGIGDP